MKQSTFSAQVANNLLTVLQGYSKTIRLLLVMFLTLTVSANAWGAEITYTHAFTTKPSIGNNTLSNITWSVEASNLNNYNSGYAGVQFGTSKVNGSITLTSVNAWGEQASTSYTGYTNVKYVYVWLNAGSGTPTATVTIGGKAASKSGTVSKNTAANSNYENTSKLTFTPTSGGNTGVIVITASTSSKAGYIAAIEVVCETPAASCTTPPTVSSASNSNITSTTATVSCTNGITSLGSAGCSITSYGFVYGTSSNPTISNTKVQVGTTYTTTSTAFSKELTGLTANTTYYVRPYATNGNGTAYGTQTSFKTLELPKYTVTFDAGSGTCDDESLTETSGGVGVTLPTANPPAACATDGWEFAGWWTGSVAETTTSPGELLTAGSNYKPTTNCTLYAVYSHTEAGGGGSTDYVLTNIGDIADDDIVIITMTYTDGTVYALSSSNGSSDTPPAPTVTVSDNKLSAEPADALKWNISNSSGTLTIYPNGTTENWLYCTDSNNGVRIGTNANKAFTIDTSSGYLKNTSTNRYVGVYRTNPDWRCYDNTTGNTANQTLGFYVKSSGGSTTTYNSNPSCEVCENILTINKGAETNGTFILSPSGEIETCDGVVEVVVTPTPAEHYHVASVTANTGETAVNNGDGTYTITYIANSTGESTINVTFEEDAKASITLSELNVPTTDNTTYYVGETYTLPSTSSQSCAGKQLVGWSTVEVAETDTKPTSNYYELGAEVTLAATQTFYAVFATSGEGGVDDTDYSNVHTSNVALDNTGGTNATNSQVKIGGIDYTAVKAGTGSASGAVKITVPAGTTKLSFHMAGWNGEGNKTISLSGATADPSSFKTVADAGVSGSSTTYTLSGTIADYFYSTTLSNINTETTLTFSNGGADQRFVIWGVNAPTGGGVSYTAYTTSCIPTYSITYDFEGGTGNHCSNTSVPQGDPYTICDDAPTKEGNTFLHWSYGVNTYNPSDVIATVTTDITLTAVWQPNTYTVTWNNNGVTTSKTYNHGETLEVPEEEPESCDGVKEFVGWTTHSGYYHATTAPDDIFTTKTTPVTATATYYAVFATKGAGGTEFVLGESGTFKMYANVNGTNYYAQGGVSSSQITSTTNALSASEYTLTHTVSNKYTIQFGNAYIGHSGSTSTNLNTTETLWTITAGENGSWRITSPVNESRALAYRASTYNIFKAYSMTNVEAGDTEYFDIEFGTGSSGYSDYTTICQTVESIEIANYTTEFFVTDEFAFGGTVTAHFDEGEPQDVTDLAHFSGYNMEATGTQTVTVTYMGATATYEITVKPLDNAWVLTWNVSGKTNTGLGPRSVTKGSAIGTLPVPDSVPAACAGKTFMGWTESNIVPSDGVGIVYITPETKPDDNTTYYAVFATVNNFCTQKPIDQIASGSKVVIVAVASLTDDGGAGKAISSRATDDTYNLQGDDVAIYDQTINTPHSTCIWTITKSGEKYIFTQDGNYLNAISDNGHYNLRYSNTQDTWTITNVVGMVNTYRMQSTVTNYFAEFFKGKFTLYYEANDKGDFDMQFYVTANANGNADITDYTTGCAEYTITYYGFHGGYSTSCSSDGTIVLPVNSLHTVPDCGDVVTDHTNLGREFLNVWMTQPHGGHTFKPGDTFILTQDTTLYAQWKMETTSDVTTLPTDIEDLAGTDIYVYGGTTLNIQPGTTTINSLTLKGGLQADGSYKMPTVWVPEGATLVRNSNKIYLDLVVNAENWYPFAVPFETKNTSDIHYLHPDMRDAATYGQHFDIKTYDGARRADVGEDKANNWVRLKRHTTAEPVSFKPGIGYIISAMAYPGEDTATIRIPMSVPNTWFKNGEQAEVGTTVRNTIAVTAHDGAAATEHQRHAGWNFVANPYLTSFAGGNVDNDGGLAYINGELIIEGSYEYGGEDVPYVTVPAYDFAYYSQHKLSDVKLSPEWSFFVQVGIGGTMNFTTAGRQQAPASIAARNAEERPVKMDVDLILSDNHSSDQTGLIICDRYTDAYEIGRDLEKLFGSAYNLSVYTLMEDNTPLAFQALAIRSSMQVIPVGYRAPEQGEYTFRLNEATSSIDLLNEQYEQLVLVDYQTGELTNLLYTDYTFYSERTQSNSRFAIYAVPRQNAPTDLPNAIGSDEEVRKVIYNDHLYILRDGNVYNGMGQKM